MMEYNLLVYFVDILTPLLCINDKREPGQLPGSKCDPSTYIISVESRSPDLKSVIFPSQAMRSKDYNMIVYR